MRIIQLLPTVQIGDAVSNDCRALRRILKEDGFETAIYAENVDDRLPKGEVEHVSGMKPLNDADVMIYHLSTGTALNESLSSMGGHKIFCYHNITPPSFFKKHDTISYSLCREGFLQARRISDVPEYCLADSQYNKEELISMGYTCPIDVLPILIPFSDYKKRPDPDTKKKYSDQKTNILFVGRVAPNKKHEDLIAAFAAYRKLNPKSRLILAGSYHKTDRYAKRLKAYAKLLGVQDAVVMPGHSSFADILAFYRTADIFWCMSEHEGFCVPLVEAMCFDIPIVAYDSTAVGGTLGGSGVLLRTKDPYAVAAVTERILNDGELRSAILKVQRERLADFSYDKVAAMFRGYMKSFLERIKEA